MSAVTVTKFYDHHASEDHSPPSPHSHHQETALILDHTPSDSSNSFHTPISDVNFDQHSSHHNLKANDNAHPSFMDSIIYNPLDTHSHSISTHQSHHTEMFEFPFSNDPQIAPALSTSSLPIHQSCTTASTSSDFNTFSTSHGYLVINIHYHDPNDPEMWYYVLELVERDTFLSYYNKTILPSYTQPFQTPSQLNTPTSPHQPGQNPHFVQTTETTLKTVPHIDLLSTQTIPLLPECVITHAGSNTSLLSQIVLNHADEAKFQFSFPTTPIDQINTNIVNDTFFLHYQSSEQSRSQHTSQNSSNPHTPSSLNDVHHLADLIPHQHSSFNTDDPLRRPVHSSDFNDNRSTSSNPTQSHHPITHSNNSSPYLTTQSLSTNANSTLPHSLQTIPLDTTIPSLNGSSTSTFHSHSSFADQYTELMDLDDDSGDQSNLPLFCLSFESSQQSTLVHTIVSYIQTIYSLMSQINEDQYGEQDPTHAITSNSASTSDTHSPSTSQMTLQIPSSSSSSLTPLPTQPSALQVKFEKCTLKLNKLIYTLYVNNYFHCMKEATLGYLHTLIHPTHYLLIRHFLVALQINQDKEDLFSALTLQLDDDLSLEGSFQHLLAYFRPDQLQFFASLSSDPLAPESLPHTGGTATNSMNDKDQNSSDSKNDPNGTTRPSSGVIIHVEPVSHAELISSSHIPALNFLDAPTLNTDLFPPPHSTSSNTHGHGQADTPIVAAKSEISASIASISSPELPIPTQPTSTQPQPSSLQPQHQQQLHTRQKNSTQLQQPQQPQQLQQTAIPEVHESTPTVIQDIELSPHIRLISSTNSRHKLSTPFDTGLPLATITFYNTTIELELPINRRLLVKQNFSTIHSNTALNIPESPQLSAILTPRLTPRMQAMSLQGQSNQTSAEGNDNATESNNLDDFALDSRPRTKSCKNDPNQHQDVPRHHQNPFPIDPRQLYLPTGPINPVQRKLHFSPLSEFVYQFHEDDLAQYIDIRNKLHFAIPMMTNIADSGWCAQGQGSQMKEDEARSTEIAPQAKDSQDDESHFYLSKIDYLYQLQAKQRQWCYNIIHALQTNENRLCECILQLLLEQRAIFFQDFFTLLQQSMTLLGIDLHHLLPPTFQNTLLYQHGHLPPHLQLPSSHHLNSHQSSHKPTSTSAPHLPSGSSRPSTLNPQLSTSTTQSCSDQHSNSHNSHPNSNPKPQRAANPSSSSSSSSVPLNYEFMNPQSSPLLTQSDLYHLLTVFKPKDILLHSTIGVLCALFHLLLTILSHITSHSKLLPWLIETYPIELTCALEWDPKRLQTYYLYLSKEYPKQRQYVAEITSYIKENEVYFDSIKQCADCRAAEQNAVLFGHTFVEIGPVGRSLNPDGSISSPPHPASGSPSELRSVGSSPRSLHSNPHHGYDHYHHEVLDVELDAINSTFSLSHIFSSQIAPNLNSMAAQSTSQQNSSVHNLTIKSAPNNTDCQHKHIPPTIPLYTLATQPCPYPIIPTHTTTLAHIATELLCDIQFIYQSNARQLAQTFFRSILCYMPKPASLSYAEHHFYREYIQIQFKRLSITTFLRKSVFEPLLSFNSNIIFNYGFNFNFFDAYGYIGVDSMTKLMDYYPHLPGAATTVFKPVKLINGVPTVLNASSTPVLHRRFDNDVNNTTHFGLPLQQHQQLQQSQQSIFNQPAFVDFEFTNGQIAEVIDSYVHFYKDSLLSQYFDIHLSPSVIDAYHQFTAKSMPTCQLVDLSINYFDIVYPTSKIRQLPPQIFSHLNQLPSREPLSADVKSAHFSGNSASSFHRTSNPPNNHSGRSKPHSSIASTPTPMDLSNRATPIFSPFQHTMTPPSNLPNSKLPKNMREDQHQHQHQHQQRLDLPQLIKTFSKHQQAVTSESEVVRSYHGSLEIFHTYEKNLTHVMSAGIFNPSRPDHIRYLCALLASFAYFYDLYSKSPLPAMLLKPVAPELLNYFFQLNPVTPNSSSPSSSSSPRNTNIPTSTPVPISTQPSSSSLRNNTTPQQSQSTMDRYPIPYQSQHVSANHTLNAHAMIDPTRTTPYQQLHNNGCRGKDDLLTTLGLDSISQLQAILLSTGPYYLQNLHDYERLYRESKLTPRDSHKRKKESTRLAHIRSNHHGNEFTQGHQCRKHRNRMDFVDCSDSDEFLQWLPDFLLNPYTIHYQHHRQHHNHNGHRNYPHHGSSSHPSSRDVHSLPNRHSAFSSKQQQSHHPYHRHPTSQTFQIPHLPARSPLPFDIFHNHSHSRHHKYHALHHPHHHPHPSHVDPRTQISQPHLQQTVSTPNRQHSIFATSHSNNSLPSTTLPTTHPPSVLSQQSQQLHFHHHHHHYHHAPPDSQLSHNLYLNPGCYWTKLGFQRYLFDHVVMCLSFFLESVDSKTNIEQRELHNTSLSKDSFTYSYIKSQEDREAHSALNEKLNQTAFSLFQQLATTLICALSISIATTPSNAAKTKLQYTITWPNAPGNALGIQPMSESNYTVGAPTHHLPFENLHHDRADSPRSIRIHPLQNADELSKMSNRSNSTDDVSSAISTTTAAQNQIQPLNPSELPNRPHSRSTVSKDALHYQADIDMSTSIDNYLIFGRALSIIHQVSPVLFTTLLAKAYKCTAPLAHVDEDFIAISRCVSHQMLLSDMHLTGVSKLASKDNTNSPQTPGTIGTGTNSNSHPDANSTATNGAHGNGNGNDIDVSIYNKYLYLYSTFELRDLLLKTMKPDGHGDSFNTPNDHSPQTSTNLSSSLSTDHSQPQSPITTTATTMDDKSPHTRSQSSRESSEKIVTYYPNGIHFYQGQLVMSPQELTLEISLATPDIFIPQAHSNLHNYEMLLHFSDRDQAHPANSKNTTHEMMLQFSSDHNNRLCSSDNKSSVHSTKSQKSHASNGTNSGTNAKKISSRVESLQHQLAEEFVSCIQFNGILPSHPTVAVFSQKIQGRSGLQTKTMNITQPHLNIRDNMTDSSMSDHHVDENSINPCSHSSSRSSNITSEPDSGAMGFSDSSSICSCSELPHSISKTNIFSHHGGHHGVDNNSNNHTNTTESTPTHARRQKSKDDLDLSSFSQVIYAPLSPYLHCIVTQPELRYGVKPQNLPHPLPTSTLKDVTTNVPNNSDSHLDHNLHQTAASNQHHPSMRDLSHHFHQQRDPHTPTHSLKTPSVLTKPPLINHSHSQSVPSANFDPNQAQSQSQSRLPNHAQHHHHQLHLHPNPLQIQQHSRTPQHSHDYSPTSQQIAKKRKNLPPVLPSTEASQSRSQHIHHHYHHPLGSSFHFGAQTQANNNTNPTHHQQLQQQHQIPYQAQSTQDQPPALDKQSSVVSSGSMQPDIKNNDKIDILSLTSSQYSYNYYDLVNEYRNEYRISPNYQEKSKNPSYPSYPSYPAPFPILPQIPNYQGQFPISQQIQLKKNHLSNERSIHIHHYPREPSHIRSNSRPPPQPMFDQQLTHSIEQSTSADQQSKTSEKLKKNINQSNQPAHGVMNKAMRSNTLPHRNLHSNTSPANSQKFSAGVDENPHVSRIIDTVETARGTHGVPPHTPSSKSNTDNNETDLHLIDTSFGVIVDNEKPYTGLFNNKRSQEWWFEHKTMQSRKLSDGSLRHATFQEFLGDRRNSRDSSGPNFDDKIDYHHEDLKGVIVTQVNGSPLDEFQIVDADSMSDADNPNDNEKAAHNVKSETNLDKTDKNSSKVLSSIRRVFRRSSGSKGDFQIPPTTPTNGINKQSSLVEPVTSTSIHTPPLPHPAEQRTAHMKSPYVHKHPRQYDTTEEQLRLDDQFKQNIETCTPLLQPLAPAQCAPFLPSFNQEMTSKSTNTSLALPATAYKPHTQPQPQPRASSPIDPQYAIHDDDLVPEMDSEIQGQALPTFIIFQVSPLAILLHYLLHSDRSCPIDDSNHHHAEPLSLLAYASLPTASEMPDSFLSPRSSRVASSSSIHQSVASSLPRFDSSSTQNTHIPSQFMANSNSLYSHDLYAPNPFTSTSLHSATASETSAWPAIEQTAGRINLIETRQNTLHVEPNSPAFNYNTRPIFLHFLHEKFRDFIHNVMSMPSTATVELALAMRHESLNSRSSEAFATPQSGWFSYLDLMLFEEQDNEATTQSGEKLKANPNPPALISQATSYSLTEPKSMIKKNIIHKGAKMMLSRAIDFKAGLQQQLMLIYVKYLADVLQQHDKKQLDVMLVQFFIDQEYKHRLEPNGTGDFGQFAGLNQTDIKQLSFQDRMVPIEQYYQFQNKSQHSSSATSTIQNSNNYKSAIHNDGSSSPQDDWDIVESNTYNNPFFHGKQSSHPPLRHLHDPQPCSSPHHDSSSVKVVQRPTSLPQQPRLLLKDQSSEAAAGVGARQEENLPMNRAILALPFNDVLQFPEHLPNSLTTPTSIPYTKRQLAMWIPERFALTLPVLPTHNFTTANYHRFLFSSRQTQPSATPPSFPLSSPSSVHLTTRVPTSISTSTHNQPQPPSSDQTTELRLFIWPSWTGPMQNLFYHALFHQLQARYSRFQFFQNHILDKLSVSDTQTNTTTTSATPNTNNTLENSTESSDPPPPIPTRQDIANVVFSSHVPTRYCPHCHEILYTDDNTSAPRTIAALVPPLSTLDPTARSNDEPTIAQSEHFQQVQTILKNIMDWKEKLELNDIVAAHNDPKKSDTLSSLYEPWHRLITSLQLLTMMVEKEGLFMISMLSSTHTLCSVSQILSTYSYFILTTMLNTYYSKVHTYQTEKFNGSNVNKERNNATSAQFTMNVGDSKLVMGMGTDNTPVDNSVKNSQQSRPFASHFSDDSNLQHNSHKSNSSIDSTTPATKKKFNLQSNHKVGVSERQKNFQPPLDTALNSTNQPVPSQHINNKTNHLNNPSKLDKPFSRMKLSDDVSPQQSILGDENETEEEFVMIDNSDSIGGETHGGFTSYNGDFDDQFRFSTSLSDGSQQTDPFHMSYAASSSGMNSNMYHYEPKSTFGRRNQTIESISTQSSVEEVIANKIEQVQHEYKQFSMRPETNIWFLTLFSSLPEDPAKHFPPHHILSKSQSSNSNNYTYNNTSSYHFNQTENFNANSSDIDQQLKPIFQNNHLQFLAFLSSPQFNMLVNSTKDRQQMTRKFPILWSLFSVPHLIHHTLLTTCLKFLTTILRYIHLALPILNDIAYDSHFELLHQYQHFQQSQYTPQSSSSYDFQSTSSTLSQSSHSSSTSSRSADPLTQSLFPRTIPLGNTTEAVPTEVDLIQARQQAMLGKSKSSLNHITITLSHSLEFIAATLTMSPHSRLLAYQFSHLQPYFSPFSLQFPPSSLPYSIHTTPPTSFSSKALPQHAKSSSLANVSAGHNRPEPLLPVTNPQLICPVTPHNSTMLIQTPQLITLPPHLILILQLAPPLPKHQNYSLLDRLVQYLDLIYLQQCRKVVLPQPPQFSPTIGRHFANLLINVGHGDRVQTGTSHEAPDAATISSYNRTPQEFGRTQQHSIINTAVNPSAHDQGGQGQLSHSHFRQLSHTTNMNSFDTTVRNRPAESHLHNSNSDAHNCSLTTLTTLVSQSFSSSSNSTSSLSSTESSLTALLSHIKTSYIHPSGDKVYNAIVQLQNILETTINRARFYIAQFLYLEQQLVIMNQLTQNYFQASCAPHYFKSRMPHGTTIHPHSGQFPFQQHFMTTTTAASTPTRPSGFHSINNVDAPVHSNKHNASPVTPQGVHFDPTENVHLIPASFQRDSHNSRQMELRGDQSPISGLTTSSGWNAEFDTFGENIMSSLSHPTSSNSNHIIPPNTTVITHHHHHHHIISHPSQHHKASHSQNSQNLHAMTHQDHNRNHNPSASSVTVSDIPHSHSRSNNHYPSLHPPAALSTSNLSLNPSISPTTFHSRNLEFKEVQLRQLQAVQICHSLFRMIAKQRRVIDYLIEIYRFSHIKELNKTTAAEFSLHTDEMGNIVPSASQTQPLPTPGHDLNAGLKRSFAIPILQLLHSQDSQNSKRNTTLPISRLVLQFLSAFSYNLNQIPSINLTYLFQTPHHLLPNPEFQRQPFSPTRRQTHSLNNFSTTNNNSNNNSSQTSQFGLGNNINSDFLYSHSSHSLSTQTPPHMFSQPTQHQSNSTSDQNQFKHVPSRSHPFVRQESQQPQANPAQSQPAVPAALTSLARRMTTSNRPSGKG